jgi:hypothetical protein
MYFFSKNLQIISGFQIDLYPTNTGVPPRR